jgi:hypothetical protein
VSVSLASLSRRFLVASKDEELVLLIFDAMTGSRVGALNLRGEKCVA